MCEYLNKDESDTDQRNKFCGRNSILKSATISQFTITTLILTIITEVVVFNNNNDN